MKISQFICLTTLLFAMGTSASNAMLLRTLTQLSYQKTTARITPILTHQDDVLFFAAQVNDATRIRQLLNERNDAKTAKDIVTRVNCITEGNCWLGFLEDATATYNTLKNLRPVNLCTQQGFTATMIAVFYRSYDALHILIERGSNIEATTNNGDTALHIAAACGDAIAARMLINRGLASVLARNNQNKTPCDIARECGHSENTELMELLDIDRAQLIFE